MFSLRVAPLRKDANTFRVRVNYLGSVFNHLSAEMFKIVKNITTLQPLYNTVRYNTVLDITRFKDGSQKCIDYIEK